MDETCSCLSSGKIVMGARGRSWESLSAQSQMMYSRLRLRELGNQVQTVAGRVSRLLLS